MCFPWTYNYLDNIWILLKWFIQEIAHVNIESNTMDFLACVYKKVKYSKQQNEKKIKNCNANSTIPDLLLKLYRINGLKFHKA